MAKKKRIKEMTYWTLVQHSGFGYGGKPGFERGIEPRQIGTMQELQTVASVGGYICMGYPTSQLMDSINFPNVDPGSLTLYPCCEGSFSSEMIDELRIYIPAPNVERRDR